MGRQGRTDDRASPRDDVEDARRKARLLDQLGQPQGAEGGDLGRLENDGVAHRECRGELPGSHRHGEVPRDDGGHHTDGLVHGVVEDPQATSRRHRDGAALELAGPAREVAEQLDGRADVDGPCDGDRLAVVRRLEQRQLVGVLLDEIGEPVEQASPAVLVVALAELGDPRRSASRQGCGVVVRAHVAPPRRLRGCR
jgi:hypothetical protein